MFKTTMIASVLAASFSAPVLAAEPMNMYSGGEGGFYESTMNNISLHIAKRTKRGVQTEVVNSAGSVENVQAYVDGDADMIIAQADALVGKNLAATSKFYNAHTEAVYFLVNKAFYERTGTYDLEDLEGEALYVVMAEGSGGEVTWKNFAKEDGGYKVNVDKYTILVEDNYEAAEIAAAGFYMKNGTKVPVAGMLTVARPGFLSVTDIVADFGKKLVIGEATDGDFNDAKDAQGNKLYTDCGINSAQRQGIEAATMGDQDTVCMRAQVVYNTAYGDQYGKQAKKVNKNIRKAINGVL